MQESEKERLDVLYCVLDADNDFTPEDTFGLAVVHTREREILYDGDIHQARDGCNYTCIWQIENAGAAELFGWTSSELGWVSGPVKDKVLAHYNAVRQKQLDK